MLTASLMGCGWVWCRTGDGREVARDLDVVGRWESCDCASSWKERAVGVEAELLERLDLVGSGGSGGEGERECPMLTSIR